MAYIGASPPATALTASDIADGIISEAKMANDAISLAELKAGTDGEVISWDASGNPVAVGVGSDGQVLTSTGAGSPPAFEAAAAGGVIVQVVQKQMTAHTSQAGGGSATYYDISGFSQAFTPSKASSKILVELNCTIGNNSNYGGLKVQADIDSGGYADIGMPDTSGSRTKSWIGSHYHYTDNNRTQTYGNSFLWTPSYTLTDVITFKVLWSIDSGATVNLNRCSAATDSATRMLGTSHLTLWEIN